MGVRAFVSTPRAENPYESMLRNATSEENSRAIWKFALELADYQQVEMPEGAEIISVAVQGELVCLWAIVNPARPAEYRGIQIVGTGNPIPANLQRFIGTVQIPPFVWHVFEVTPG